MPQPPAKLPPPPPKAVGRPSGEYGYVAREEQPAVPSEKPAPEPPRSLSPNGVRVELSEKGFDARVRGNPLHRFAPYIVPAVLSILAPIGTGILGYFEGLKRGAARVAAVEFETDKVRARLKQQDQELDGIVAVERDHEPRILRLERTLKLDPAAAAIISSPSLVVTKPAVP
jgi:hypothetical protein